MKIVINKCYGGYSLSPLAVKELAKLEGKKCYFFKHSYSNDSWEPISLEEAQKDRFVVFSFSIPNPESIKPKTKKEKDYIRYNKEYEKYSLSNRPEDRSDKNLIKIVEKLGEKANASCAKLVIVEIPDGTDYEISDYDGMEHIAEKHNTWY